MTERASQSYYLQPDEVAATLAMATTGELHRNDMQHPAIDLSRFTTYEIVSTIHAVDESYRRIPTRKDDPRHAAVDERDRRLAAYWSDLGNALERLPDNDPEKTRDVFTILTESEYVTDRRFAGTFIGFLTRVDHDYGLELWRRLLHDDHADVAADAWESVKSPLTDLFEGSDESLREDGITREDLFDLTSDYVSHLTHLRRDAEGLPWDGSGSAS